jgi:hypothetical protein
VDFKNPHGFLEQWHGARYRLQEVRGAPSNQSVRPFDLGFTISRFNYRFLEQRFGLPDIFLGPCMPSQ